MSWNIGPGNGAFMRKSVNIFLLIILNICFRFLKEPSQWDGSFEHLQHMFWLRNKKEKNKLHTLTCI